MKDPERAAIKSLQPFEAPVRPLENHPAWVIHELSRLDKHRALITQNISQRKVKMTVTLPEHGVTFDVPPNLERVVLEDRAEIGRLVLATDDPLLIGRETHVQVKGKLDAHLHAEDWPMAVAVKWPVEWIERYVIPTFDPILG